MQAFTFKLPFGIQKAQKVAVNVYQKIELGYRTDDSTPEGYEVVDDEGKMITGDYNIVNVDFFVEYKVSNPERYLYGSYSPEEVLRNLIQKPDTACGGLHSGRRCPHRRQGGHSDAGEIPGYGGAPGV